MRWWDSSEMWTGEKSSRDVWKVWAGHLDRGKELNVGQTDRGREGVSVWWWQTEAFVLSSLPFHRLHCDPRVLGLAAPLSECLGCTASYAPPEPGLAAHQGWDQVGCHSQPEPRKSYLQYSSLVYELANRTDDNSMLLSAALSAQVTVIWVLGLKISELLNH